MKKLTPGWYPVTLLDAEADEEIVRGHAVLFIKGPSQTGTDECLIFIRYAGQPEWIDIANVEKEPRRLSVNGSPYWCWIKIGRRSNLPVLSDYFR